MQTIIWVYLNRYVPINLVYVLIFEDVSKLTSLLIKRLGYALANLVLTPDK